MGNISVTLLVLLLVGIPQSFLSMLSIHLFTQTKITAKKYVLLNLSLAIVTYLIRLLPILIGVNTVLTLLVTIMLFQFAYKSDLSKTIRIIISTITTFLFIAISEVFNMMFLILLFDREKANALIKSSDSLTQGISTAPSNIFFAALIIFGYFIYQKVRKGKHHGRESGEKVSD